MGIAGPYDAFSPHYNWVTPRYLAIDQGTIVPYDRKLPYRFIMEIIYERSRSETRFSKTRIPLGEIQFLRND